MTGKSKSKSSKTGGATFGYVEQFNYPLSPCYKNQAKAGWHSGGDGSCAKKTVEGLTFENEISGGGFFDWIMGKEIRRSQLALLAKRRSQLVVALARQLIKRRKKSQAVPPQKRSHLKNND